MERGKHDLAAVSNGDDLWWGPAELFKMRPYELGVMFLVQLGMFVKRSGRANWRRQSVHLWATTLMLRREHHGK